MTHLYTLIVKPDNTYEVRIDNEKVESGELEKDWDFLPPKKIKDPEAKKPEDWDDKKQIDDPEDKKPEVREFFLFLNKCSLNQCLWGSWTLNGSKLSLFYFCCFPQDWDKPQHIPDPDAKKPEDWDDEIDGEWEAPMIDNPDYKVCSFLILNLSSIVSFS